MGAGITMLPATMNTVSKRPKFITLPQYLLANPGQEWESFEDVSDWTVDLGTAVDNNTPGEFRSGSQSIKVTTPVGSFSRMDKPGMPGICFGSAPHVRLYYYLYPADYANFKLIRFYVVKGNWLASRETVFGAGGNAPHSGWNISDVTSESWAGSANWATTTFDRIRIRVEPQAGTSVNISIDSLWVELEGYPAVLFTFDDGIGDIYSQVYPILKHHWGRGTFYINTDLVNDPGLVTDAQLREMDAAGWSIANHSDDATILPGYTQAQIQAKLTNAANALAGWGVPDHRWHVAYPGTGWNETVLSAMAGVGALTGRVGELANCPLGLDVYGNNYYNLPVDKVIQAGATFATLKPRIDGALTYKKTIIFYQHNCSTDISPAELETAVAYIRSLRMPMITIADLYASLSGPVRVRGG